MSEATKKTVYPLEHDLDSDPAIPHYGLLATAAAVLIDLDARFKKAASHRAARSHR
jgi:hypothetical protein